MVSKVGNCVLGVWVGLKNCKSPIDPFTVMLYFPFARKIDFYRQFVEIRVNVKSFYLRHSIIYHLKLYQLTLQRFRRCVQKKVYLILHVQLKD